MLIFCLAAMLFSLPSGYRATAQDASQDIPQEADQVPSEGAFEPLETSEPAESEPPHADTAPADASDVDDASDFDGGLAPDDLGTSLEEGQPMVGDPRAQDEAGDGRLRFSFSGASWREVLTWLAEQSDMALHVGDVPVGTFTYSDPSAFTTDEAIARLNLFMIPQGFAIVRRDNLISVLSLNDPRSLQQLDALAKLVALERLEEKASHEVVKVIVPLGDLSPADATGELQPLMLMSPPVVLPRSNQLMITETVGKVRSVLDVLDAMRSSQPVERGVVRRIDLKHVDLETVVSVAGRHLGILPDSTEGVDISISSDASGRRLYVTGSQEKLQQLDELLEVIDVPSEGEQLASSMVLRSHAVSGESLQSVYEVLQTILAGQSLRLSMQPSTNKIVALAEEQVHQQIEQTIAELSAPSIEFAVVPLGGVDPYFAVNLVDEMFATADDEDQDQRVQPPKVDADPGNRRLFVRGTSAQIEQVRDMVSSLAGDGPQSSGSAIRFLPLVGPHADQVLDAAERSWRGDNQVTIHASDNRDGGFEVIERTLHPQPAAAEPAESTARHEPLDSRGRSTERQKKTPASEAEGEPARYLQRRQQQQPRLRQAAPTPSADDVVTGLQQPAETMLTSKGDGEGQLPPPIRGQRLPEGVVLQSDDVEALSRFEELLRDIASRNARAPSPPIVYYLKYVTADQAVKMLADLFDGGKSLAPDRSEGLVRGGSRSLNNYYFGSLTHDRDGLTTVTAGTATIVSDGRLNRLIIQGTKEDVALIESYLKIIDKADSMTNIEVAGRSRVIELVHTKAPEVAEMIKEAYAGRVAGADQAGRSQDQADNRSGGRSNDDRRRDERREVEDKPTRGRLPEMTVAVHEQSNSLVITAPDSLFAEVEALVQSIDQRGEEVVEVVSVPEGVDLEMIRESLQLDENSSSRSGRSSDRRSRYSRGRSR